MAIRALEANPVTPVGHRPTPAETQLMRLALAPLRWMTAPRVTGLDHVHPHRPGLLVGNHTLFALLDAPLLLAALHETFGILPRPLGDHLHFRVPLWRTMLERFGVVDGTPENLRALMEAREWVILFPGGAREVFKQRGEQYTLLWGERMGFARLAIECGYPIIPFSAVGADDAWDIVFDAEDILASPLGPLVERLAPRRDVIPPVVRGIGLTPLPRVERLYFHLGEPIETRYLVGREGDPAICFALRERVRRAIEEGITTLLLERARDPDRPLLARLLHRGKHTDPVATAAPPRRATAGRIFPRAV